MEKKRLLFSWGPLLAFLLFLNLSCSQTDEERKEAAIHSAKIYLTKKECDNAIKALADVGMDMKHARFVQTLASAYACKSGFTEPVFFGTNIDKLSGAATDSLIGSLTTFTTSPMLSPTDSKYTYLQRAIDTIIYAGEVDAPTVAARATVFTENESLDMNIQALYMILAQMGKYAFYYGNADPTLGIKGLGAPANGNDNNLSNGCFYDYDPADPVILAYITQARTDESVGSCTLIATGHPQMVAFPNDNTVTRMCQGVVLFNQFMDILLNTAMPPDAGDLTDLSDTFADLLSLVPGGVGSIISVRSQSECETSYGVPGETDKLQGYFFFIYESLFK